MDTRQKAEFTPLSEKRIEESLTAMFGEPDLTAWALLPRQPLQLDQPPRRHFTAQHVEGNIDIQ